jgi:ArsR family transcriptional regulator, virulence genes transcriptional regulator
MDIEALASRAAEAEEFLKALANRHRLLILCELHKGESSVNALSTAVGLSQSSLSQHLAKLRAEGLVHTRRESQTIFYSLADEAVSDVIALLHSHYCQRECAAGSAPRAARIGRRRK